MKQMVLILVGKIGFQSLSELQGCHIFIELLNTADRWEDFTPPLRKTVLVKNFKIDTGDVVSIFSLYILVLIAFLSEFALLLLEINTNAIKENFKVIYFSGGNRLFRCTVN